MWKLIIFFSIFGFIRAAPDRLGIVNGTDASEGEFKFAVSLRVQLFHSCGGTILNRRFILTAAHCVTYSNGSAKNPKLYNIQYGILKKSETNDKRVPIKAIYAEPIIYESFINDAAVLELEHDLPDDGTWEPVELAKTYDTSVDSNGIIIGWGKTGVSELASETLQKLEIDIYSDSTCESASHFNKSQHICFGATFGSACFGDSGGPLLNTDKQQIGIASYITNNQCIANRKTPNVYSRIEYFYEWIQEHSKI